MNWKTAILPLILFSGFLLGQFPLELIPDEITDPVIFTAGSDTEFLLTIVASSNTNWAQAENESATLVVTVDGDWNNYNQDIVLYAGQDQHYYHTSLGPIVEGEHSIEFKFDYAKSSPGAALISIESIELTDNFVSSDIKYLIDQASREAVESDTRISNNLLLKVATNFKPSVSIEVINKYLNIKNKFENQSESSSTKKNPIGFRTNN